MPQMPKILLIGDSLTQNSFCSIRGGSWGAKIANACQRRCDILNRGLSGYNTRWALNDILNKTKSDFIDTKSIRESALITVWFGANDAANDVQNVPLEEYGENLLKIGEFLLKSTNETCQTTKIIFLTPPPVDNKQWPNRNNNTTLKYAEKCLSVSESLNVTCLNVFSNMIVNDNWPEYLCDGLHLSEKGGDLIFELLTPELNEIIDNIPMMLKDWKDCS